MPPKHERRVCAARYKIFFSALLLLNFTQASTASAADPAPFSGDCQSVAPYGPTITRDEVRHLMDKVAFGQPIPGITDAPSATQRFNIDPIIDLLLYEPPTYLDSVQFHQMDGLGLSNDNAVLNQLADLAKHYLQRYLFEGRPFYASYTLFLLQQYASSQGANRSGAQQHVLNLMNYPIVTDQDMGDGTRYRTQYLPNIRVHQLQNLRLVTDAFLFDPITGPFLNLPANLKNRSNQNYPRELLEIFTMGTFNPANGAPNYNENDVQAMTQSLTGFRLTRNGATSGTEVFFQRDLWDSGAKTLFPKVAGTKTAAFNYESAIDRVYYDHPATANNLAQRMFGLFVHPNASKTLIGQLGTLLKSYNFEPEPFMRVLMKSQAMYCRGSVDSSVSSPIWYYSSIMRRLGLPVYREGYDTASDHIRAAISNALHQTRHEPLSPDQGVFGWSFIAGSSRDPDVRNWGQSALSESSLFFRLQGLQDIFGAIDRDHAFDWFTLIPGYSEHRAVTSGQLADSLANKLGITLEADQRTRILAFLDTTTDGYNTNGTVRTRPRPFQDLVAASYTNTAQAESLRQKVKGVIRILAALPQYILN
ncbi:MAG: DUF1800 family protein [Bdellovibrionota bacterium]